MSAQAPYPTPAPSGAPSGKAATASYPQGSYTVARGDGLVTVTGTAPYRGAAGWIGGQARCAVTTIDEADLP